MCDGVVVLITVVTMIFIFVIMLAFVASEVPKDFMDDDFHKFGGGTF